MEDLHPHLKPSTLCLENGLSFEGFSPEWQEGTACGEVVFSTGMTGYDLSLTDPSYSGQILLFTSPIIGNYGIPPKEEWESKRIYAKGVAICTLCRTFSHQRSVDSLLGFLKKQNVPLITDVDTRQLTKLLRETGTMAGAIVAAQAKKPSLKEMQEACRSPKVSIAKPLSYGVQGKKVVVVDCGIKENILRSLQSFPLSLLRVPSDYDYSNEEFDAILLSNGPGNPEHYGETIAILKKAMRREKPIFGICLGAQLLALASGAKTYKLPYGHRGHNQPCMELKSKRCFITSQNHGYAVKEESLPNGWEVSFRNLNDATVEGISHRFLPFFAVQFHPEAAPGPTDTAFLFDRFYEAMQ